MTGSIKIKCAFCGKYAVCSAAKGQWCQHCKNGTKMIDHAAEPLRSWIDNYQGNNITHAARALGVNRSTLHRVMDTAYVINGTLYTIKRKAK